MAEVPKSIRASLYIDGRPAESSLKNLKAVTQTLRRELDGLTVGTDAWNRAMRNVQLHEATLRNINNEVRGVGGAFGWLRTEIGKLGALAVGVLGFQFITDQFHNVIMSGAKLSDSLADIRRVAGLTEKEVLNLNKSFKGLDTRTSVAGLRDIAIIAGKLGVAKGDILAFTEAVDKLVVTLGDELGNADQITTQLGKILNVFDGKVTGENITTLGNAMIVMANAGVASGGFIADFTQRVSGIAVSAHLSLGATVGLAAGLEELGQKTESSSTAVSRLLSDIAGDLPKAAAIAQIPLQKFTDLFNKTPEKALLAYAAGLVKNKTAFSEISASFKSAGEEGQRVIGTLAALGNKAEFMQGKIDMANGAITQSSAINAGFALKNETFGASVEKLGKKFGELSSNSNVTAFMQNLVFVASAGIDAFKKYANAIAMMTKMVVIAGVAWATYRLYLAAANSQSLAFIVNMVRGEAVMALSRTSTIALAGVNALLARDFGKAAQAARLLNVTLLSNPIGVILAAVAATVAAVILFKDATNDAAEAQKTLNQVQNEAAAQKQEEISKLESLNKIMTDHNELYSDRILAMKEIKSLLGAHLKGYTDEQILAGDAAVAIKDYVKQLKKKAEAEVAYEEYKKLQAERLKIDQGDGELNFGQNVGLVLTDIFAGSDNGEKYRLKTQKSNKTNAQHANQVKQDALTSAYELAIKNAILGKTEPENDKGTEGPILETVEKKRKALQDQIHKLETDYDQLAAVDKAGREKNINERRALQKQLDELDGKEASNKKTESITNSSRTLTQMVKEFNSQQLADQMAKNQKEIKDAENKYDHLIALEKKWLEEHKKATPQQKQARANEIGQLEADKKKTTDAIKLRQEQDLTTKIKDLRISLGNVYETELQKERDRINAFYDEQLKAGYDQSSVETNRAKDLTDAKIREEQRFQDAVDGIRADGAVTEVQKEQLRKARINKKYDDEIEALKKKFSKELQATEAFQNALKLIESNRQNELKQRTEVSQDEINDAIFDKSIEAAQNVANGVFEIGRASRQAETDAEINKLEKQKERELSNKDLTEGQRTAIQEKYAKQEAEIKLKAWEADKDASLAQAEINMALAITKALTSAPWPLNLISAAGAAVAAGVEIAKISSMKPPEFATGGFSDEDPAGYVGQPTIFKKSASGRPFVAGEAGREWIAPNWMLQNPRTANIIGMLESARRDRRAFASGGFNGSGAAAAPVIHNNFDVNTLVAEMQLTRQAIKDQKILFSMREFERENARQAQLKNNANV
jgi:hypothetical protein